MEAWQAIHTKFHGSFDFGCRGGCFGVGELGVGQDDQGVGVVAGDVDGDR